MPDRAAACENVPSIMWHLRSHPAHIPRHLDCAHHVDRSPSDDLLLGSPARSPGWLIPRFPGDYHRLAKADMILVADLAIVWPAGSLVVCP